MIIMDVKIDNLYAFRDFEVNFSYPKKIVGSTIPEEHLPEKKNFRYKKAVILMGANATGKTSLGLAIRDILHFLASKSISYITNSVCDSNKKTCFSIDFVTDGAILNRISCNIDPGKNQKIVSNDVHLVYEKAKIRANDSYESCCKRLKEDVHMKNYSYIEKLDEIDGLSWMFDLSIASMESSKEYNAINRNRYVQILQNTLKALDPRIKEVVPVDADDKTYLIKYANGTVLLKNGEVIDNGLLSSGTYEGINIANLIASIKTQEYDFFYCDEKFSHIHGQIEKAFLSLLIDSLSNNQQLFFTSHNTELLDMDLPHHSFVFMRRRIYGDEDDYTIDTVSADEFLKRGTDSLRCAVENDLFSISPDLELIYQIAEV